MGDTTTSLSDQNAIAYNSNVREQLKTLHEMLGAEITDVASGAMDLSSKLAVDGEKIMQYLSKMASQLSIALINARKVKDQLTPEEQQDYESIRNLTAVLGNLQDKLNRVIKSIKEVTILNSTLSEQGLGLAEYIIEAQEQFRDVRSNINAFGLLSKNPEMSYLFDKENQSKDQKPAN